jgi:nucleotide-binding universal stress UspA family protein
MKPFQKILVPVDFSEHSARAVRLAAEVASHDQATLDLVHVYDPIAYLLPEGYLLYTPEQLTRLFHRIQQRLSELKAVAQAAGVAVVEAHVREGIVDADICALAAEGAFDLIVMGTRGRSGLSHMLLGSVTERVVRSAPCPVLTVKAERTEGRPELLQHEPADAAPASP